MKKILKRLVLICICTVMLTVNIRTQKVYATGAEIIVAGEVGTVLLQLLLTALAVAGVTEVATNEELKASLMDAWEEYCDRSYVGDEALPQPGPVPSTVIDGGWDVYYPEGSVVRVVPKTIPGEENAGGSGDSNGEGEEPPEPSVDDKTLISIHGNLFEFIGKFISQIASGEIQNESLNPLFTEGVNFTPDENGIYHYNFILYDQNTQNRGHYIDRFVVSMESSVPVVYYDTGTGSGYADKGGVEYRLANFVYPDGDVTGFFGSLFGTKFTSVSGILTRYKKGSEEFVSDEYINHLTSTSAVIFPHLGDYLTTNIPIFANEESALAYLESGQKNDVVNAVLDNKDLAESIADILQSLTDLENGESITSDTLEQIQEQLKDLTDAVSTQPEPDLDALKDAMKDAVQQAVDDTKVSVQPSLDPDPLPDIDPAADPASDPDFGFDIFKEIGEGIMKITLDIKLFVGSIIEWLKKIFEAILNSYELLEGWFSLDMQAISSGILSVKDVAHSIPIISEISGFADIIGGIDFSDSYEYPKIIVKTPKILMASVGTSEITLVDFGDYAKYLLWARTILKVALYIGLGFYILKEFSVRFHVA